SACFTAWVDVLYFYGLILGIAIGTLPAALVEQVLSDLVAREGPLLVVDASDFGVVHLLQVKLDQFLTDGCDRTEAHDPLDPGDHVAHPTLDRGGDPPFFLGASVVTSGLAVPALALPPTPTGRSPFL